jgi:protein-S-isoprenylcysteine O-methyltransferase Ste14
MIADKIFYADAQHHVIVTDSTFIVKNKEYNIPSIRDHIIKEIKPIPFLGLIVSTIGVLLALGGIFHFVAFRFIPNVTVMNMTFGPYSWAIAAGVLVLISGLFMIATTKPQYALHISTPEGENDVIVSPQREPIKQIIDALNRAFMLKKK